MLSRAGAVYKLMLKRKIDKMNRRGFLKSAGISAVAISTAFTLKSAFSQEKNASKLAGKKPNILFCFADDWSFPHAGAYGDKGIKTPVFDKVAADGVLFERAHVAAPSCAPSRAAVLSGQYPWRLREAASLWSLFPKDIPVYPELLEKSGYFTGFTRKGWGPGNWKKSGRPHNPAGREYKNFARFLKSRPASKPFCFWFGSKDPHRPYNKNIGKKQGVDPKKVSVPHCLPDLPEIREDIANYYGEIQRFDFEVGRLLKQLERIGELENTLVVVSSDNGMPHMRCKSTLYDMGTHVPLAIRWGKNISKPGRRVNDFVSLIDLAPTFLQAAGVKVPAVMTGKSLLNILESDRSGMVDKTRDAVFTHKERHAAGRVKNVGYPCRAIQVDGYHYIINFKPDRWPMGDPKPSALSNWRMYRDIDVGPSKDFLINNRSKPGVKKLFDLAVSKNPAEELYDMKKDPGMLENVASDPAYAKIKSRLRKRLLSKLKQTGDPRVLGKGDAFDKYPYTAPYFENRHKWNKPKLNYKIPKHLQ